VKLDVVMLTVPESLRTDKGGRHLLLWASLDACTIAYASYVCERKRTVSGHWNCVGKGQHRPIAICRKTLGNAGWWHGIDVRHFAGVESVSVAPQSIRHVWITGQWGGANRLQCTAWSGELWRNGSIKHVSHEFIRYCPFSHKSLRSSK